MAQPVLTGLFWWCIKGCSDRKQGAYKTNRIRCKFAHFSTWTWSWTHLVCGDLWGDYLHIMRVNNYDFAHTRLSSISRENLLPYIALQIIISCKRFKKKIKKIPLDVCLQQEVFPRGGETSAFSCSKHLKVQKKTHLFNLLHGFRFKMICKGR